MAGQFWVTNYTYHKASYNQLYVRATFCYNWWWESMYVDAITFYKKFTGCAMATGVGREKWPSLHPIATCEEAIANRYGALM